MVVNIYGEILVIFLDVCGTFENAKPLIYPSIPSTNSGFKVIRVDD